MYDIILDFWFVFDFSLRNQYEIIAFLRQRKQFTGNQNLLWSKIRFLEIKGKIYQRTRYQLAYSTMITTLQCCNMIPLPTVFRPVVLQGLLIFLSCIILNVLKRHSSKQVNADIFTGAGENIWILLHTWLLTWTGNVQIITAIISKFLSVLHLTPYTTYHVDSLHYFMAVKNKDDRIYKTENLSTDNAAEMRCCFGKCLRYSE